MRLETALCVESFKYCETHYLLHLEIVFRLVPGVYKTPSFLPSFLICGVILCASFRVGEYVVSLRYLAEARIISRLPVIRVITLREHAIDSINRLRFRTVTDLKYFVIIYLAISSHLAFTFRQESDA